MILYFERLHSTFGTYSLNSGATFLNNIQRETILTPTAQVEFKLGCIFLVYAKNSEI